MQYDRIVFMVRFRVYFKKKNKEALSTLIKTE